MIFIKCLSKIPEKGLTNARFDGKVLQESEKKNAMTGNSKLVLLFSERCRLV